MPAKLDDKKLHMVIEAAIFVADKPMSIEKLKQTIFADDKVSKARIKSAIVQLQSEYQERGVSLVRVSNGYRFQAKTELAPWLGKLWTEKPAKYSRALLETLALIAYKQPITRGEIENVRGVSVSSNIMRTLSDRNWIKVVGHKEVPGRPSLYATTSDFLDYFSLASLDQLPQLMEPEALELVAKRIESEFMGVSVEETR